MGNRFIYIMVLNIIRKTWNAQDAKAERLCNSQRDGLQISTMSKYHTRIPLHNNPAEIALRELVIKKRISYGTKSEDGRLAWENMMTILDTCRKHGVSFLYALPTSPFLSWIITSKQLPHIHIIIRHMNSPRQTHFISGSPSLFRPKDYHLTMQSAEDVGNA